MCTSRFVNLLLHHKRILCFDDYNTLQLQAYFLVLDDIMDNSHTRRGQPCWFRLPKVHANFKLVPMFFSVTSEIAIAGKAINLCILYFFVVGSYDRSK